MSRSPKWGYAAFPAVLLTTEKCSTYLCMFIHKYACDIYMMCAKRVHYKKVFGKAYLNGRHLAIRLKADLSNTESTSICFILYEFCAQNNLKSLAVAYF